MPHFEIERELEIQQIRNRLDEIRDTVYTSRRAISRIERVVTGKGRGPEAMPKSGWKPFATGDRWGRLDETTWFRLRVRIPKSMSGKRVVALIRAAEWSHIPGSTGLTEGGESLVYLNGKPFQGLDRNRDELLLATKARGGEHIEIVLEACPSTRFDLVHTFMYADLAEVNALPWSFYWDAFAAVSVCETLDANYAPRRQLLELVNECVKGVDLQTKDEGAYAASLSKMQRKLGRGLKDFSTSYGMGSLTLAGHAHIDTAWLWPVRETKRKCSRTFATILELMDRYPDFYFSCSQAVQYAWMKEYYPDLFRRIKKRVKEGRWELCGAPWVEPDHNIPSGESLIRQYLYGNRWFEKEFGRRSHIAWVPDSFGYNWQLPQIMSKCQLSAFVTTKIDWSQFTEFPYSMFLWEGADGTRIPAVMPPLNYNGNPQPADLIQQWERFKQKERVEELPFAFGWGDGGGGPTMEMIEMGARMENMVGVPRCEFGRIEDCVDRMVEQCDLSKLPVYNDELYLELHRGCQTSQSRTKRNNRACEVDFQQTEFLSTLCMLAGGAYPSKKIEEAWKIVLTNQFHDILPGTSLNEVFAQCDEDYARARGLIAEARGGAMKKLLRAINTTGAGQAIVVFNALSWVRDDVAEIVVPPRRGAFSILNPKGDAVPWQRIGKDRILFSVRGIPPLGYAVYRIVNEKNDVEHAPLRVSTKVIENEFLRIRIDSKGTLSSIYDKAEQREVLAPKARGNLLQIFDDRPHLYEAWDVDPNFEEKQWEPASAERIDVVEDGPLRAVVRIVRKTDKSTITQDLTLCAGSRHVAFVTHVDWHEKQVLMKAAFPVDVRASQATYEIQFATIQRPTHRNRAHDYARYEVAAQRWADLSEGDYGVSVLNDCKYGYDIHDNVLRLSLLRSPIDPDPHADEGEHEFTYALYPHSGDWRNGCVQEAAQLNNPLIAEAASSSKGTLPSVYAFAVSDCDNVIIETVKRHEDSDGIVLRVYEAYGQRGEANLTFSRTPKRVFECDCMEENDVKLALTGNNLGFYVRPYEIRTFKVFF